MGEFQARITYFLVSLALFACNSFLLSHARHLKPLNQHSSLNTNFPPPKTSLNHVATPTSEKKSLESDTGAAYTNAFEPTTPGNSPGVGHRSFTGEDNNKMVAVQSPDDGVVVTDDGSKSDFKPTDPGHSPGVGHAYQNKIEH